MAHHVHVFLSSLRVITCHYRPCPRLCSLNSITVMSRREEKIYWGMLHVLILVGPFIFRAVGGLSAAHRDQNKPECPCCEATALTVKSLLTSAPSFWTGTLGCDLGTVQTALNWPQLFFTASTPAAVCNWSDIWPAVYTSYFLTYVLSWFHWLHWAIKS